ncbi:cotranscriptional regulator FAM172A homolog isoform X1 [Argonauta hians]
MASVSSEEVSDCENIYGEARNLQQQSTRINQNSKGRSKGRNKQKEANKNRPFPLQANITSTDSNRRVPILRKPLKDFNYEFNKKGQLRHIETGESFKYHVSHNQRENEKHYEEVGEAVTDHIYELLQKELDMEKKFVPTNRVGKEPRSFIFCTKDALTNPNRLLLLVHGSGAVRAGQWARRLIINDCLDSGSQLPFVKRAVQAGFAVLVLNTNYNRCRKTGTKIRGSGNALEHLLYVWDNFVAPARARHVTLVCHSYGGVIAAKLADQRREFLIRVSAVAFTDSMPDNYIVDSAVSNFFRKKSRNWVTSEDPLDTEVETFEGLIPCVSAGHTQHEMTSWSSIDSIFKYLTDKVSHGSTMSPPPHTTQHV